jgi:hypothetical protein
VDAPLPGTAVFDRLRADPRVWHFAFHDARDVAELLVAGREREYLQAFFNARIFDPSAIGDADLEIYASAYAAPGGMRAGFELDRAFDRDAEDNRASLSRNGKLTIPVLAVGGATSTSGPLVEEMMREVADDVAGLRVPATAHWVPEENPQESVHAVLEFTEQPTAANHVPSMTQSRALARAGWAGAVGSNPLDNSALAEHQAARCTHPPRRSRGSRRLRLMVGVSETGGRQGHRVRYTLATRLVNELVEVPHRAEL